MSPLSSIVERKSLTPENIFSEISYFYEQTHFLHLQTTSHAQHVVLNVWEEIVDFKDKIIEYLLGCIAPARLGKITLKQLDYSITPMTLMDYIISFTNDLSSYARMNGYKDLDNISQDLEGVIKKTKYFLTQS